MGEVKGLTLVNRVGASWTRRRIVADQCHSPGAGRRITGVGVQGEEQLGLTEEYVGLGDGGVQDPESGILRCSPVTGAQSRAPFAALAPPLRQNRQRRGVACKVLQRSGGSS